MAQDYEETIKELKEQIVRLQQVPKRQNSREKKPAIDSEVKEHRSTPEHLKLTMQSVSDASHGLVERPGAEVTIVIINRIGHENDKNVVDDEYKL